MRMKVETFHTCLQARCGQANIQSYYTETCGFPISNFRKPGSCPQLAYSLTAHRVRVTKQTLKYFTEELILLLCMITAL